MWVCVCGGGGGEGGWGKDVPRFKKLRFRGCTSGEVYAPCIYKHAR